VAEGSCIHRGDRLAPHRSKEEARARKVRLTRHPVLANSTHESNLPASWSTLYVLSRIPEQRLEHLIIHDKVHAGLTRQDAERLVSKVPNRVADAIQALVDAMNQHAYEDQIHALAADVRKIRDEAAEDEWSMSRERCLFSRLDDLSAWIARFHEAWQRVSEECPADA
jgi:hypothetical protein